VRFRGHCISCVYELRFVFDSPAPPAPLQLREQVKQRLLEAQQLVEARERDLAVQTAAMQAKHALSRSGVSPDESDDADGAESDAGSAALSASVSTAGGPDQLHGEQQEVSGSPAPRPIIADGRQPEDNSSTASQHSDSYREHLRIRARALQAEQEQLERAVALRSHQDLPGFEEASTAAPPPASAVSTEGWTEDSGAGAFRQTQHTSQRIGELDLALDRLLHRLAPTSSHTVISDTVDSPAIEAWTSSRPEEAPVSSYPTMSIGLPSAGNLDLSATADAHAHVEQPPAEGRQIDSIAELRYHHSQQLPARTERIEEVETALSQLQQRYDAMASGMQLPLPSDDDGNNGYGCSSSDTMSCSSLSSELSSRLGANSNSTQLSFLAQSDLSDEDGQM
jgi:hypothetical protein